MITFWKNRVSQVSDPRPRKAAPAVALQPAAKMVAIPKISPAVGTALHGQARGESAEPSAAAFVESLASAAKAAPPPPPATGEAGTARPVPPPAAAVAKGVAKGGVIALE